MKVGDFVVKRLHAWGVRRIYGYPGDGINGVIGALQRAGNIEFIQVRHEEMAAFMAVAHAKFTGELGVCLSTGGSGATHLITGLYDGKLDHAPVLAICGQAEATVRGASYQQELNLDRAFADVAGFVQEASAAAQVRHLLDRCVRVAKANNEPTVIILPKDIQDEEYEEPAVAHGFTRSGVGYTRPRVVPEDVDLAKAADILNAGNKVAILIGAGARGAAPLLIEMVTMLGAGVAKALLGKDILPDDLPFVTGAIGLLGTEPSWDMMQGCDTLLMVGTGFPWSEFLPKDGAARAVQIDIEASMLSLRYPADVNLHGDAAQTVKALLTLIRRKEDRDWSKTIEANVAAWWKKLEGRAKADAKPVNPQRVVWEMSPLLPPNAIVTSDSGSCANWYARDYRVQQGQSASLSGGPGLDGCGRPVRHRRQVRPSRPSGHRTCRRRRHADEQHGGTDHGPEILEALGGSPLDRVRVQQSGSQRGYLGQRVMEGNPKFDASQDIPDFAYAKFGEMLGFRGIFVDSPDRLASAWQERFPAIGRLYWR
jgi:pyruvate dehydrogenase (quinone)